MKLTEYERIALNHHRLLIRLFLWIRLKVTGQVKTASLRWYEPHDHGDGIGPHQHFPENTHPGHDHTNTPLILYPTMRGEQE